VTFIRQLDLHRQKSWRQAWVAALVLLATGVVANAAGAAAAPAGTATVSETPDFSGFWIRKSPPRVPNSAPPDLPEGWRTLNAFPPPLRPEAYEVVKSQRLKEAAALERSEGTDPQTARCGPAGMPDMMFHMPPLDIVQRRDEIVMLTERERTYPRHIYITPFHPLSKEYDPRESGNLTPNGHSVAHWEGKTLVIRTDGFDPEPYMASIDRVPHSDEMTIEERLSLDPSGRLLSDQMTVTDAKTLLRPWTFTLNWVRAPLAMEAIQQVCMPEPGK
jgi:hypothetical protein